MLHVLHVIQIIEVLLYIKALHVKALHFKANCMDFIKNKRPFRETYDITCRKSGIQKNPFDISFI